jgi:hypothetical protein
MHSRLTSSYRLPTQLPKLLIQILLQPLDVHLLGLSTFHILEPCSVRRLHMVKHVGVEDGCIRKSSGGMECESEGGDRIAVVGELPGNKVCALRLEGLVEVL